jgi:hypothetical protein
LRPYNCCDIIFSIKANPFCRVCPYHFYGICNQHELIAGCVTGKIYVLFMIRIRNLHFLEIEDLGTKFELLVSHYRLSY